MPSSIQPTLQDRDGGVLVMSTLFGMYPFLRKLYADGWLSGAELPRRPAPCSPLWSRCRDRQTVRPGERLQWSCPSVGIVERTIAWLNRCRRLAKDWECLNRSALAFLRLGVSQDDAQKTMSGRSLIPDGLLDQPVEYQWRIATH